MGSSTDHQTAMIEQDIPTYAPSLPVPNVQEMVRKNPLHVPERYIRNQEERPKSTDRTHLSSEIPIIDLFLLSNGQEEELKKLDVACKEWGFFQVYISISWQVVNHGVAEEVLQRMKDASAGFFDLALEEKNEYSMPPNDIQGYGHAYVVSEEQKLDWSDALILVVYPSRFRRLQFWPAKPNQLGETIEAYSSEVRRVAEELLSSISLIMGLEDDALSKLHKELVQVLRVNYYPICAKPDQVLGISPHSDSSTISILMQEENVDGLEIRHDGDWVPVKPIPNALVVNIGDVVEILSDGKYKSVEHRAVTNGNRARISYATFLFPHDDIEIGPLDRFISPDRPSSLYKKVRYGDFLRQSLNRKLEGKSHTQMARSE
ncbi:protein SRG1-like [Diospyros lotus]|uniref:protein SRG1-like n=1 Tax=Diospyros lotus TaxID=55363 RepID=UPI00225862A8|nr:protein SRG1-like [Diospyros lotus]